MSLCPICGRVYCDHTPSERGQSSEGKFVPQNVVTETKFSPQVMEKATAPFLIKSIDHEVIFDQINYHIHATNFDWLCFGSITFVVVTISKPSEWEVNCGRLGLTYNGKMSDHTNDVIGCFANHGLVVNKRFIEACLFPIQNQILEIEGQLKSFQ